MQKNKEAVYRFLTIQKANQLLTSFYRFCIIHMLRFMETVAAAVSSVASEGREKGMEIRVGENESLESALKRFKRKCARSGVLAEVRRREHYEKPSVKRKKKAEAARKRKY